MSRFPLYLSCIWLFGCRPAADKGGNEIIRFAHTEVFTVVRGNDSTLTAENQWFKITPSPNGVMKCELFLQSFQKKQNQRTLSYFSTERLRDSNQVNKRLIRAFRDVPLEFTGGGKGGPVILLNYNSLADRIRQDAALARSSAARFYLDSNTVKKMVSSFFMTDAGSYLLKEIDTVKGLDRPVSIHVTKNSTQMRADSVIVNIAMEHAEEENVLLQRNVLASGRLTRHLRADTGTGLLYSALFRQRIQCRFPEKNDSMVIVNTKRIIRVYKAF